MEQGCNTGRTRAETKPMEIIQHGEVAQPNEQHLKEGLMILGFVIKLWCLIEFYFGPPAPALVIQTPSKLGASDEVVPKKVVKKETGPQDPA